MALHRVALFVSIVASGCPKVEAEVAGEAPDALVKPSSKQGFLEAEPSSLRNPCQFLVPHFTPGGEDFSAASARAFAGCEAFIVKVNATSSHAATGGRPPKAVGAVLEVLSGTSRRVGERLEFVVVKPEISEQCATGIEERRRETRASAMATPGLISYLVVGGFAPAGGPFLVNEQTITPKPEMLRSLVLQSAGLATAEQHAAAINQAEEAERQERAWTELKARELAEKITPVVTIERFSVVNAELDAALATWASSRLRSLQGCYKRALRTDPKLEGTVGITFVVSRNHFARIGPDLDQDALATANGQLRGCLKTTLRGWVLPFSVEDEVDGELVLNFKLQKGQPQP